MVLDFSKQKEKKLVLIDKRKTNIIDVDSILYLDCNGYVTSVYQNNCKTVSVSRLLKYFQEELEELGFVRVSHNTIVNLKHVSVIESTSKGLFLEINSLKIKVSRRKKDLFKTIT